MSSTSQYTSYLDLYTGLLNAVRADTTATATANQAKRYINIALQDMHLGTDYKFPWAERNAVLVTQPEYTTGTLTATQGSATLTGAGTAWNSSNVFGVNNLRVGGKIQIAGGLEVYEITAIASDTSATMGHLFTPETVTAGSYTYFEDTYALSTDFLRPIDQQLFSTNLPITLIDRQEFRRRYVRNYITGKPTVAAIYDFVAVGNTTPVRKIRFHRPPNVAFSIPYTYITENLVVQTDGTAAATLANDTDEPIVPERYRHALVLHALYHWYRDKKNDPRSKDVKNEYTDIMLRTVSDVEVGARRVKFRPATGLYRGKAQRPYHAGSTSRYSLNNRFDRFE